MVGTAGATLVIAGGTVEVGKRKLLNGGKPVVSSALMKLAMPESEVIEADGARGARF